MTDSTNSSSPGGFSQSSPSIPVARSLLKPCSAWHPQGIKTWRRWKNPGFWFKVPQLPSHVYKNGKCWMCIQDCDGGPHVRWNAITPKLYIWYEGLNKFISTRLVYQSSPSIWVARSLLKPCSAWHPQGIKTRRWKNPGFWFKVPQLPSHVYKMGNAGCVFKIVMGGLMFDNMQL